MSPEISTWLLLSLLPRTGPATLNRLRLIAGDGLSVLNLASPILKSAGMHSDSIYELERWRSGKGSASLKRALQRITDHLQQSDGRIVSIDSPGYPFLLKQIHDPPVLLYIRGDPELLTQRQIAIVGSRNASAAGRENAYGFARQLSLSGWVVTSGLAVGVDAQAHLGALDGFGLTLAVMATGVDRVYPSQHQALAQRIVEEGGVLISEFPPGTLPRAQHFPRRNRIISGLSMATLVVEASPNSGSLITARQAMNQGREVFALPGSIHNPMAKGCHELIREGAKLVEEVSHLFEELGPQLKPEATLDTPRQGDLALAPGDCNVRPRQESLPSLATAQQRLLDLIDYDTTSVDQLVQRSELAASEIISALLELELLGYVVTVAGGYQRVT